MRNNAYLDCTSASDDLAVPNRALHDHDRIVQAPLYFFDKLLCAPTQQ